MPSGDSAWGFGSFWKRSKCGGLRRERSLLSGCERPDRCAWISERLAGGRGPHSQLPVEAPALGARGPWALSFPDSGMDAAGLELPFCFVYVDNWGLLWIKVAPGWSALSVSTSARLPQTFPEGHRPLQTSRLLSQHRGRACCSGLCLSSALHRT